MSESLGDAVLELRTNQRRYERDLDRAEKKAQGLEARFQRIGRSLSGFGDRMSTRVSLPLAAIGAATFKLAADAEENANKFNVVMGRSADAVRERLEELTATIPLTRSEMEGMAAGIQDMLVPMGVARTEAAGMSGDFVQLAGDMGSFSNVPVAQVLNDIQSALAGSSEPMRKYGVDTRVTALQQVALEAGLLKLGEEMTSTVQAQAVLIQTMRQTKDATGDAANTVDSASNSVKFFWRDIKDLGIAIGQDLIPVITPLINDLRGALKWLQELSPETRQWGLRIAAVAVAAGPLLSIVGRLTSIVGLLIKGFQAAAVAAGLKTAATVADTAATVANTAAQTGNATAVAGLVTTQAARTTGLVASTAATTATTGATGLLSGALGKAGLVAASLAAGVAVGTLANVGLKKLGFTIGNLVEKLGGYGESIEEINATLEESTRIHLATGGSIDKLSENFGKTIPLAETIVELEERLATEAKAAAAALDTQNVALDTFSGTASEAERAMWALVNSLDAYNLTQGDLEVGAIKADEIMSEWGERTLPNVVPPLTEVKDGLTDTTQELGNFLGSFKTGIPAIDGFLGKMQGVIKMFTSLVSGIGSAIKGIGSFFSSLGKGGGIFSKISGLLGGGKGGIGGLLSKIPGLGGLLGGGGAAAAATGVSTSFSVALPSVVPALTSAGTTAGAAAGGGILSGLTGAISGGASAVGGAFASLASTVAPLFTNPFTAIAGGAILAFFAFKKFFGKPSKLEIAGREAAGDFRKGFDAFLSQQQLDEIGSMTHGTMLWRKQTVVLRDSMMALGATEAETLAKGRELWEAEKQGPEAVKKVIASIQPMLDQVSAAMKSTGLDLTELRDLAINKSIGMGISIAEAFAAIADGTISTMQAATDAVADSVTSSTELAVEATQRAADRISSTFSDMRFEIPIGFTQDKSGLGGIGLGAGHTGIPALAQGAVVTKPTVALIGEKEPEGVFPLSKLGQGGGSITINLDVDGERMTTKVVQLTPQIRRQLGIG